jgi:hypothetical protein
VQFFYVYKALVHPENSGYVPPFTLQERLMHVAEAKRTLGSRIPWLCDTMANDLKHAVGDAPNSEFVIDPEGRVIRRRLWSEPDQLRKDLEELIGPVEHPTRTADLDLKTAPPPRVAARGVVPRVPRPPGAKALVVEPIIKEGELPFYAKLRAEAAEGVLVSGAGQIYLGFHLDPLYHVHWNNLTPPIRVTLTTEDGCHVAPAALSGPKVDAREGDMDPREFLIDVRGAAPDQSLKVSVAYFACNDEEGWCKLISQEYVVRFAIDHDGGWVQRAGKRKR